MVPNVTPRFGGAGSLTGRETLQMAKQLRRSLAVVTLALIPALAVAQNPGPVLRRVPVDPTVAAQVSDRLNLHYQSSGSVTVAVDPGRGDQLMVMAPASQQATIATEIGHLAGHLSAAGSAPGGVTVALQSITWRELEDALRLVAGPSAAVTTSRNGERASFPIADPSGKSSVRVDVDRRQNTVTVQCREDQTAGWQKLLAAIDSPLPRGTTLHIHRVVHAEFAPIQRAVRLLRSAEAVPPRTASWKEKSNVRQVAFQDAEAAPNAGGDAAGGDSGGGDAAPGGLIGDTDVQFIPESGLIIIRGNRRDVDRIRDVIAEIEKQSELTRPEVRLRQLENADSSAVASLLTQLYDDVLSARQGDVSITALETPNSLLLIGRAEAVAAVMDLIDKIDQPVAESDRLRVFRLQHASAVDAEETIREFFTARPGSDDEVRPALGPRVRVTADYRTNSLIVSAAPRDIEEVTRLIEKLDVVDVPSTSEIRVFQLLNSQAETLQEVLQSALADAADVDGETTPPSATLSIGGAAGETLRSGVLAGIVITADTSANAIVVRGPAAGMALIAELIRQLDQTSGVESLVKVFTVQNGDAAQLTTALQTLFGEDAATSGTSIGAGNAAGLAPATAGESALVPLRFSTDVRTNSIIASGSAEDLEVVESILLRLDSTGFAERITEVIWLRHQAAANIATAIQDYVSQRLQSQSQIPQLQTGLGVLDLPDRDIIAVPEIQTNSLLISVSPRLYEEVRRLIDRLDRRPPMVLIKTLIAEVTLTDGFEIGGQVGLQDSILFDRGKASGAIATANPASTNVPFPQTINQQIQGGTTTTQISNNVTVEQFTPLQNFLNTVGFNFGGTTLPNANSASQGNLAARGNTTLGVAGGTLLGNAFGTGLAGQGFVFSAASESISLLLRALRASNRLQILSRPEVMTADNTEGLVTVGQLFPRPTELVINQFGGTQVGVEDINIGLILRVRPRVGSDGLILMDIDATRSGVSNSVPGQTIGLIAAGVPLIVPAIDQTVAQSTITAFDGQTVVFGGLIQKNRQNFSRKVPYLADIPYLGVFFKYEGETEIRSELLVVMTPSLITGDEDLEYVKQSESSRMSWCLADVVEAHGDVGLNGGYGLWGPAIGPTIYPDLHPTVDVFPPGDLPHGPRAVHPTDPRYGAVLEAMLASPELIEAPPVLLPMDQPIFEDPIIAPPTFVAPPAIEVAPLPPPATEIEPLPMLQLEAEPAAHRGKDWFKFKRPRDA